MYQDDTIMDGEPCNLDERETIPFEIKTKTVTKEIDQKKCKCGKYEDFTANDKKIEAMLLDALSDEYGDAEFYCKLIDEVRDPEDKDILNQIQLDEKKHIHMFTNMYRRLSGQNPNIVPKHENETGTLCDIFGSSVFSELKTVEFYRRIYFSFMNLELRDFMFEIITDEQAHAAKFDYLYTKYRK